MKNCAADRIRNFALAGHASSGKTSLVDLMLYKAGAVSRKGSVDDGTSVSDFRPEEREHGNSLYASMLHLPWQNHHLFALDTPGYAEFSGEAAAAVQVSDMVLIVIDAVNGVETGTIRAWKLARDNGIPRAFFINGLDKEQADFDRVLGELQDAYGATAVVPVTLPQGAKESLSGVVRVLGEESEVPADSKDDYDKYREMIMDTVAETDEDLMERYLGGEQLSEEEVSKGLHAAVREGQIVPVFVGSVSKDVGVDELMTGAVNLFPDPLIGRQIVMDDGEPIERKADGPGMAQVFKSVSDPFIGQMTYFRVYSGTIRSDGDVNNVTQGTRERFGSLVRINGKEQEQADEAGPGEIVAVAKLKSTHISDTLATESSVPQFPPLAFMNPTMSYAVFPESKGDEEKIGTGLTRLAEEDPTLKVERNPETNETLLYGMGDQHINNVVQRLEKAFKVKVCLETPKVPYRETITANGTAVYRHKKQTGGHGQFAEVHLRVEPLPDDEFEFGNEVVGGNIPKNFIPAVEKGITEALGDGPLANCRVINIKAVVFDGKHHPVDSSEMAFKIAGRGAFRDAMTNARPQLLEQIMKLKITFPDEYMGDITGDLNSRRGRILGMDREEGMQVLNAEVPMAEVFTYSSQLRSITQGRGTFEMEFGHYDPVPGNLAKQIQEQAAAAAAEE